MFYLLAGILIISAIMTVTLKNLFHCALSLITALLAISAFYFTLGAPFVGVFQLIIYVGAIMILMIFAIMLTTRLSDKMLKTENKQVLPSVLAISVFLFFSISAIMQTKFVEKIGNGFDPLLDLGRALLTTYILPFEVISLVLLAALIGAIVIGRDN